MMQKHSVFAGGDAAEILVDLVGPIAGRLAAAGVAEVVDLSCAGFRRGKPRAVRPQAQALDGLVELTSAPPALADFAGGRPLHFLPARRNFSPSSRLQPNWSNRPDFSLAIWSRRYSKARWSAYGRIRMRTSSAGGRFRARRRRRVDGQAPG